MFPIPNLIGRDETPELVGKLQIFFNNVDQRQADVKVIRANIEEGWIDIYAKDAEGRLVDDEGYLVVIRLYGNVRVETIPQLTGVL